MTFEFAAHLVELVLLAYIAVLLTSYVLGDFK